MPLEFSTNKVLSFLAAWILILLVPLRMVQAQPGTIDPTFNPGDAGFGTGVGASNTIRAMTVQEDGKLIIGGTFTSYHGVARNRIARLHPDGTLDQSFTVGSGANGEVRTLVQQPNGKVLIGGNFTTYNGTPRNRIARLHPDGTLDTSFDPGAGANALVQTINQLSDGKILISGSFTTYNNTERNYIAWLNSDGSLDTDFNPGTGASGIIHTATVQADGKIIIGGAFSSFNGTNINRIARLHPDGTLDTSFNPGTGASGIVYSVSTQPDGNILIGGAFTSYNGTSRSRIARLLANGSLDPEFAPGTGASSTVHTILLQNDGKIIIGGEFVTFNGTGRNRIARLNEDGKLDTSFDPGAGAGGVVYTGTLLGNGQIMIAGAFTLYNEVVKNRIARLHPDGSLDEDFDPGAGANGVVYATTVQEDGKILLGGAFTAYNGLLVNRIARVNSNGGLDNTFLSGTGANGDVRTVVLQQNNKIIVAGGFTSIRGSARGRIARLNSDGSLDTSFDPGTGANGIIHKVVVQPDGKLLIGGAFTAYNGVTRYRVARLNADGSLDVGFDPGAGASNTVYTIALQNNEQILLGGAFTTFNGLARNRIARLHADGSLDNSFNAGTGPSADVRTLAVLEDSKIIIGGSFTTYNGTARSRIARLNADGTLDTGFTPGAGAGATVHALQLQPGGKLLIGGDFTTYNGIARVRFARLNADGTLDTAFDTGAGANGTVHSINRQQEQILIGGAFTSYNGTGRNRIARIQGDSSPLHVVKQLSTNLHALVYPNPSQGDFYVTLSGVEAGGTVRVALHDVLGREVLTREVSAAQIKTGIQITAATLPKGVYFLRVSTSGTGITKKVVLAE